MFKLKSQGAGIYHSSSITRCPNPLLECLLHIPGPPLLIYDTANVHWVAINSLCTWISATWQTQIKRHVTGCGLTQSWHLGSESMSVPVDRKPLDSAIQIKWKQTWKKEFKRASPKVMIQLGKTNLHLVTWFKTKRMKHKVYILLNVSVWQHSLRPH